MNVPSTYGLVLFCLGVMLCLTPITTPTVAEELPFEVTEERIRCSHYDERRQPFFGTTHLHTGLSFDASIRFVEYDPGEKNFGNSPRAAYQFAQGKSYIQLPGPSGLQVDDPRYRPTIDRPLDWGAVTDHSEHFGEMGFCKNFMGKDIPERLSMECRMINGFFYEPLRALNPNEGRNVASNAFTNLTITSDGAVSDNTNLPVCENNRAACDQAEWEVWQEHQAAAEENYDRSADCSFTTFIAYENTSTPLLNNWHRNVIFRNDRVVKAPVTAIDMAVNPNPSPTAGGPNGVGVPITTLVAKPKPGDERLWPAPTDREYNHPLPQPFWNKLTRECTEGENITGGVGTRCDFITIPHNSNLGGGNRLPNGQYLFPPLFLDPYNTADAEQHQKMEPLVEIYQDKGSSECRYDPRFLAGTDTVDEFCAFEILDGKTLGSASGVGSGGDGSTAEPPDTWGPRAYVRNVWKDGIQYAAQNTYDGINPFKMGVVAASDSHTGVMGWHPENETWPGHLGIDDVYSMQRASTIQNSSGGHSVVWAEENSRDSIFEALRRKETYGTSGTRPIVRFFGGWDFDPGLCAQDYVATGYRDGVPMGGDLPSRNGYDGAPSFLVAAHADDFIATPLQQIQIIKGWVDDNGDTHERVYRIAGDPGHPLNPEANLDTQTCKPKEGVGYEQLCSVWRDPDFEADQHAFYYVRVLEEPVCRYSTLWCRDPELVGVDPLSEDCDEQLAALANGTLEERAKASQGAMCCSDQTTTPFVQPVIQERAWTSPIWYEPGR